MMVSAMGVKATKATHRQANRARRTLFVPGKGKIKAMTNKDATKFVAADIQIQTAGQIASFRTTKGLTAVVDLNNRDKKAEKEWLGIRLSTFRIK